MTINWVSTQANADCNKLELLTDWLNKLRSSFICQSLKRENPAEFAKVSNYVDFIQIHQVLNVTTSAYSRFNLDEGAIEAHFLEAAERRAEKSRIRRYCSRPENSNEFTLVNLALQQKRVRQ